MDNFTNNQNSKMFSNLMHNDLIRLISMRSQYIIKVNN